MQPEYIGSRLAYEGGAPTGDSAANFTALQDKLGAKNITALQYSPGIDTNAFVVRAETATQFSLTKMSDPRRSRTSCAGVWPLTARPTPCVARPVARSSSTASPRTRSPRRRCCPRATRPWPTP